jgi:hypothetical protein
MWPWEHVLFAYVFYSVYVRLHYRFAPDEWPIVALVLGSFFPDVIDKPLAWQFSLFETGWGIAHSVFFVVPFCVAVYATAKTYGDSEIGIAFGFGYVCHLVGDVLPASLSRGRPYLDPILWPLGNPQTSGDHGSFFDGVSSLFLEYAAQLHSLEVTPVFALQLGSIVAGLTLWLYDGRPGLRLLTWPIRRAVTTPPRR